MARSTVSSSVSYSNSSLAVLSTEQLYEQSKDYSTFYCICQYLWLKPSSLELTLFLSVALSIEYNQNSGNKTGKTNIEISLLYDAVNTYSIRLLGHG